MAHRLHVIIGGAVQGVGFRYSTRERAAESGLNGWVRNRSDGRVEAVFEGTRENLETMLDWCRRGPSSAEVRTVHHEWEEGAPKFDGFRVRM